MSKRKATASHSAQGHYRGPITRGTITDNLSCCRCSSSIDIVVDHVVLSPCHCCVCPECLLEVLAEKGAGKVDCPSCGTPVSSHHFYKGRLPRREIVRHSESAAPRMTKAELLKKLEVFENEKTALLKGNLKSEIRNSNGVNTLITKVDISSAEQLKNLSFQLKTEVENLFCVLGCELNGKPMLSVIISDNLVADKKLHAGNIVKDLAKEIQGGGGGQPFYATAGGNLMSSRKSL